MYWCRVSSRPSATTALIPWWWIWDILLRALETQESAYVSMTVADVLAPSKHQATSNHDTCIVMWITQFVLCYVHEIYFMESGCQWPASFFITDGLAFSRWHLHMRPECRNTWTLPQCSRKLIPRGRCQVPGPFSEMTCTLHPIGRVRAIML